MRPITIVIALVFSLAGFATVQAQPGFQLLHAFQSSPFPPSSPLCQGAGGALYGETEAGGPHDGGVIYKVNPDGSGFAKLLELPGLGRSGLLCSGSILYGTDETRTIFKINQDGTGFTALYSFASPNGPQPRGRLAESNGVLYGRTETGGLHDAGMIYRINVDGSGPQKLYDFAASAHPFGGYQEGHPGLVVSGSTLYGLEEDATDPAASFIYKMDVNGTGFARIHSFHSEYAVGLVVSGDVLYGNTKTLVSAGGSIFKMNLDGTGYTTLHTFSGGDVFSALTTDSASLYGTWGDATYKIDQDGTGFTLIHDFAANGISLLPVLTAGTSLFGVGVRPAGSIEAYGAALVYALDTDGSGYTDLHDFERPGGALPINVTNVGGTLIGVTATGGAHNAGTLFRVGADGSSYAKLHDFDPISEGHPATRVTSLNGVIYGGLDGGRGPSGGRSALFSIHSDGTGFSILHTFDADATGAFPDGDLVAGPLTAWTGVLFGTTLHGGASDAGAVFKIKTDGTGFTKLHDFDGKGGGSAPEGRLGVSGGALYGTTSAGGAAGQGTLFRINVDGTGFAKLHDFVSTEGRGPADVSVMDNVVYGTTGSGGKTLFAGTAFKIAIDGTGFIKLHDFDLPTGAYPNSLTVSGSMLYGITYGGGTHYKGTVFRMRQDGTGFTTLHNFGSADGSGPLEVRAEADGALYGTAFVGGPQAGGTVFRLVPPPVPPIDAPFGWFDSPADGSTGIHGAIEVSGWAVGANGIDRVELWRDTANGDGPPAANGKIFVGNATFVLGAHPEIQTRYPAYPQADRAGWSYMLLTNLLPNTAAGTPAGGVGTFRLYAYVYDTLGNRTVLPTRTFACDNRTGASKPFGTIDTPAPGQIVSGTLFNFGWVLTPLPGKIPTNGATIVLYIDGVAHGTATYNGSRSDIATLFPGYNNTNGAVAVFSIDTTTLANGLHSMAWSVTDDLGRADGIGSRYFSVEN